MARIRTIKPEFWRNRQLARVTDFARLLAIALLNISDDEGYFEADPLLIRGDVFPFLNDYGTITVALRELCSIGYVQILTTETKGDIGFIPTFTKHQVINKKSSSKLKESFEKTRLLNAFSETSGSATVVLLEDYVLEQGTWNREVEKETEKELQKEKPPKSPKGESGKVPLDLTGVAFPKEIDTPWMREAIRKWVAFRRERKPAVTMIGLEQTLGMLSRMPADVAIASIYRTIAKNWQGIQTCPPEELALFTPKEIAQAKHDAEERRKQELLDYARRQRDNDSLATEARNAPATRT